VTWERHLSRLLTLLRLDSIRRKIVALAVLATLVPATSTAVLSHVQNRRAFAERLGNELRGVGMQTVRELDLWAKARLLDVRVFASSPEVYGNLDRLQSGGVIATDASGRIDDYLTGVQTRFESYEELLIVDLDGRPVASSAEELRRRDLPDGWASDPMAVRGVIGDPYRDDRTGRVVSAVVEPVETIDTRVVGALLATLAFDDMRDAFRTFAPSDGSVDLVMSDGRRIVGSGAGSGMEQAVPVSALATLAEADGEMIEFEGADGEQTLGALTSVPGTDWSVVAQVPSSSAYAQVRRLRDSTVLLVTALMVFVGFAAYFLGLFIVRPLTRLTAAAASVAGGDLSVDLPVTTGGEVGYLTGVFNRMVAQLRRNREELAAANSALRRQNEELEHLSMTDPLTGLYNRRYVMNEFEKEVQRAERHQRSLAVLMLDVDRFKQYNDSYGHPAGDEVLRGIGRVIEDAVREPDVPGRFGGEEFIVLMPDCDLVGAIDAAERIRARLTEEVFEGGKVTCSIGAAAYPEHGTVPSSIIAAADVALYEAKAAGRDRLVAAMSSAEGGVA
jgi:diguanylate cyclase (GGDEF)-like protein